MKKAITILGCVVFALTILLPAGTLLCNWFGYTFTLTSVPGTAIATAVLSLVLLLLSLFSKESAAGAVAVLLALLSPLSLVSALFYLALDHSIYTMIGVAVFVICSLLLTVKLGKPRVLQIVSCVLTALMLSPYCSVTFVFLAFGNLADNTVVQSVVSPEGGYYAEVVDSDQGALGGDTFVYVYENKKINALVFTIRKKPEKAYHGDWGEYKDMNIRWKDEHCLLIDSFAYEVK